MNATTGRSTIRRFARGGVGRAVLGGIAAGAMVLGAGASTAAASADGCTYTTFPDEYVCGVVEGEGLHIESMDVIRGKLLGGTIRDYHAEVTVTSPRGTKWRYRSETHSGKTYLRAYRSLGIDRDFPDGSTICGSFFEGGDLQDTVCFDIHS
jgi:hypothetical protein